MNEDKLRDYVAKLTKGAENNSEAAKIVGCSRPAYVNFMNGRRPPGKRMLKKLGLVREWTYIPKPAPRAKK